MNFQLNSGTNLNLYIHSAFDLTTSGVTLGNDTWYHLCAVRSGNTFTLYVDGVQRAQTTTAATIHQKDTTIGYGYAYMKGQIQDLRISHHAKYTSASQIATSISSGELSAPLKG